MRVHILDGEHDVFGDGTLTHLHAFGRSPRRQLLRLRNENEETFFTADCCYFRRALETLTVPPFGHDKEVQRQAMLASPDLETKGAKLAFRHDPERAVPAVQTGTLLMPAYRRSLFSNPVSRPIQ